MARLLVCNSCQIMYRLRDFHGNYAEDRADIANDMELHEVIQRHVGQSQEKDPGKHLSNLFDVADDDAALIDVESAMQKQMSDVGVFIRETRDDLKVEALKCFNKHNRPKGGCIDWEDKSKIIGRKQGVAREDLQYLCKFCPVNSHVEFKDRQKKGLYGK